MSLISQSRGEQSKTGRAALLPITWVQGAIAVVTMFSSHRGGEGGSGGQAAAFFRTYPEDISFLFICVGQNLIP